MKGEYHFSVLRYVFDPITQEFVNIGVALYAPQHGFIRAICTSHYSRISKMFRRIDGASFRSMTRYIQDNISALQQEMDRGLLFKDSGEKLHTILSRILPEDDSALRFASGGVGITEDPTTTLSYLFSRYVTRYETPSENERRNEDDVWRVFREPLEHKSVISHLVPKKIVATNYEYEFERSWKNGIWHVFEPVSFDLLDGGSIVDKANRWLGRATSLMDSAEAFKLFLLLGQPEDPKLQDAFQKAENILSKIPGRRELVRESHAADFAEEVETEFREHHASEEA